MKADSLVLTCTLILHVPGEQIAIVLPAHIAAAIRKMIACVAIIAGVQHSSMAANMSLQTRSEYSEEGES